MEIIYTMHFFKFGNDILWSNGLELTFINFFRFWIFAMTISGLKCLFRPKSAKNVLNFSQFEEKSLKKINWV